MSRRPSGLIIALLALLGCRQPAQPEAQARRGHQRPGEPERDVTALIEGSYQVRWSAEGEVSGTLTLSSGTYRYSGQPAPQLDPQFHFVTTPEGRYAVRLEVEEEALRHGLESLDDGEIVAKVNFDPGVEPFESTARRKLVLIRWRAQPRALFFHSVVSELETWRIERALR